MTVATYTTNLSDSWINGTTTGWSAIGTGGAGLTADTDYFIQGTLCLTKSAFASATKGMIYSHGSDAGGSGTDGAYMAWMTHTAPNSLAVKASGGMQFLIGSGTGDYEQYYVGGSDTQTFQKWVLVAVSETVAGDTSTGTPSTTVESYFGGLWNLPSGGPTKGAPNAIDAIRYGRGDAIIEFGTGADPEATFDAAVADLDSVTNRYGLITQREPGGAFENSGLIQFGTGTNAVEFSDSLKTIFIRDHDHVTTNFNTWEANNASSIVTFDTLSVKALGTTSNGRWVTNNNATLSWTSCGFQDMGTFAFDTNSTIDNCTFLNCEAVDANGGTLNNSSILTPNVTANNSGLVWNVITDTTGLLDGMTFSKTAAVAHHAIEFGTAIATTNITLNNCDFGTDFSAGLDTTVGDETFHFLDTTGTITLNLVGCSGNKGYRSEGVVVTIVDDPATTSVHVTDALTPPSDIQNARVYLKASAGTGPLMYLDTVSTLTSTGTTATCTMSAVHGLTTGDFVVIQGAAPAGYNMVTSVVVTSTVAFTYTVDSGLATPATDTETTDIIDAQDELFYDGGAGNGDIDDPGSSHSVSDVVTFHNGVTATIDAVSVGTVTQFTIDSTGQTLKGFELDFMTQVSTTGSGISFQLLIGNNNLIDFPRSATGVLISALTDVNGDVSDIRTFSTDQPVEGWVRKSSAAPYYQSANISGTVDTVTGLSINVQLLSDE